MTKEDRIYLVEPEEAKRRRTTRKLIIFLIEAFLLLLFISAANTGLIAERQYKEFSAKSQQELAELKEYLQVPEDQRTRQGISHYNFVLSQQRSDESMATSFKNQMESLEVVVIVLAIIMFILFVYFMTLLAASDLRGAGEMNGMNMSVHIPSRTTMLPNLVIDGQNVPVGKGGGFQFRGNSYQYRFEPVAGNKNAINMIVQYELQMGSVPYQNVQPQMGSVPYQSPQPQMGSMPYQNPQPQTYSTPVTPYQNVQPQVANTGVDNSAEIIRKFKELLDMGAITQEEYDAKKKEILDRM